MFLFCDNFYNILRIALSARILYSFSETDNLAIKLLGTAIRTVVDVSYASINFSAFIWLNIRACGDLRNIRKSELL